VIRGIAIAVLVALGGLFWLASEQNARNPPQAQKAAPEPKQAPTAAEIASEAAFQRDVRSARRVKAASHDPSRFRLEQAIRMTDGTLCLTFRGSNAFGAIVQGHAIVEPKGSILSEHTSGFTGIWNRRCRKGENVTHIRQAL
jgi:hypothetical protein